MAVALRQSSEAAQSRRARRTRNGSTPGPERPQLFQYLGAADVESFAVIPVQQSLQHLVGPYMGGARPN
ncbi:hypothetical protein ACFW4M_33625 [Streptomyces sp. NPDC058794]|uniref:hypothetical protein n=1 Tax=Streptomyces sp. NPDC058794 TaxID=3346636 RepID=UPI0036ABDC19